jgi:hypothetical protein
MKTKKDSTYLCHHKEFRIAPYTYLKDAIDELNRIHLVDKMAAIETDRFKDGDIRIRYRQEYSREEYAQDAKEQSQIAQAKKERAKQDRQKRQAEEKELFFKLQKKYGNK